MSPLNRLSRYAIVMALGFSLALHAEENGPIILFLGDSLTAGYGLTKEQAYPALIEKKMIQAGYRGTIINAGISGDTTSGGLHRLRWYLRNPVNIMVIALGANDGLRGLDTTITKNNLQGIITHAKARYPAIKLVLAGMRLPPNLGKDYIDAFQNIFPQLSKKNSIVLVPFLLENVAGIKSLNLPDGIHPNYKGHKIICENVWSALQPLLKQ